MVFSHDVAVRRRSFQRNGCELVRCHVCGGLLGYNSMYFGFLFLYWIALAIYGAAFLLSLVKRRSHASSAVLSPS
jgi:ABC-type multidrug transport system permease subunit